MNCLKVSSDLKFKLSNFLIQFLNLGFHLGIYFFFIFNGTYLFIKEISTDLKNDNYPKVYTIEN